MQKIQDHHWKADQKTFRMSIYVYVKQIPNRTRDICFQSWPCRCRSQRSGTLSLNFWLWRKVSKNWQVTRGFMFWRFLSWGIDYRTENFKSWFWRITFWIYPFWTTLFPSVSKWVHHFDLLGLISKNFIRKPIFSIFKIILVTIWQFFIYWFPQNLGKISPGQMGGVQKIPF
jgi:hypothetical protein